MATLWQDVRFGWRMLARNAGFTTVAVLTLALGIGANTAVFSVVYGVIFRPLAYPAPQQLHQLSWLWPGSYGSLGNGQFQFFREHQRSFQAFAAATGASFTLAGEENAERIIGLHVSAGYFDVFQAQPVLGRGFAVEDDQVGAPRTVLLSHQLWRRRYGSDAGVIGRSILLNGVPYEVIGILPASFQVSARPDVWVPLAPVARTLGSGANFTVIGRLKAEVTREQAQAETDALLVEFRRQFPDSWPREASLGVVPYREAVVGSSSSALFLLFGAIGFVLLIACANVAHLLLARAAARSREVAVRSALGASRGRLLRQLLTETLLLAVGGALAGLLVALWGVETLLAMRPAGLPRLDDIRLDAWAFGFAFLLALLATVLCGAAPALRASKANLAETLKEGARHGGEVAGHSRLHGALVIGEMALSLVLLAGAGLLIKSFTNLTRVDPGFDVNRVLSVELWVTGTRYESTADVAALYDNLIGRLRAVPGVETAAVTVAGLPLQWGGNLYMVPEGREPDEGFSADFRAVTPAYFRALGVPLRRGRGLTTADTAGAPPVALINEAMARAHFRDRDPIGQRIWLGEGLREIVGVVGDVRSLLDQPSPPALFLPLAQMQYSTLRVFEGWFPTNLVVRTQVPPATLGAQVQAVVRDSARQVPVGRVRAMEEVLAAGLAARRFNLLLMSIFAGLAVALTAIGLYGVLSYQVARRTHEIGIRMALGARPAQVTRLVLGKGLVLAVTGLVLGLVGAVAATRLIKAWLFGVSPTDFLTLAAISILLLVVALAACWVPARRATRVDPMVALRYE